MVRGGGFCGFVGDGVENIRDRSSCGVVSFWEKAVLWVVRGGVLGE
jgi:hypothetical protein